MDIQLRLQQADAYALSKGFAFKSYFLDSIRRGRSSNIKALLDGPEYIREMEALFGGDLAFAYMAYAFVWSQAQRAAVEGGLSEESASGLCTPYLLRAQHFTSIREFAQTNIAALVEFADAVAAAEDAFPLSSPVRRCRAYIREHVCDELTVNQVSEAVHFSRSHLAHLFKSETGKTLIEFIHEEKTHEAERLIELTSLSLTEIGQKLGFCSQSHFTRAFRKVAGTTPSEWRRAKRTEALGRDTGNTHEQEQVGGHR